jgi:hypothetical protein
MAESARLAYKAYEIEELVDVYFFRRLGYVVAVAARLARLTPNQVSILAGLVGSAGGVLLYDDRLMFVGLALVVFHGVVDSADGQLARMTGQVSELGRLLDGVAGYATHAAVYLAIVARVVSQGGGWTILGWALLAGGFTALQAQMYDYHRTTYARLAIKGVAEPGGPAAGRSPRDVPALVRVYEAVQRTLAGDHALVEAALASRATGATVRAEDRARYRANFYRLVRGWNLLGDNVRRYALIVLAVAGRLEWFFGFILLPMNVVLVVLQLGQRRADRRFLAEIAAE